METPKIGVMDSGIGGLSVLREIHRLLPHHPTLYIADQGHLPYGPRPQVEIQTFTDAIVARLIEQGAAVVVIACNTASAAALEHLRQHYPTVPIVGMEPALKPAAENTRSGVVGVLSTRTTAEGAPYQRLLSRFGTDVRVITQVAPELVQIAEANSQHTSESRAAIEAILRPMLDEGVDQIALACTHFPFLTESIQAIAGAGVQIIDPAPAVARQVARVWPADLIPEAAPNTYFTSGDPAAFRFMLKTLIGIEAEVGQISLQTENQI